jgi:hypothetical protein
MPFDPEAKYAALDERVLNQGVRLGQIEQAMNRGFSAVEASLSSLSTEFRTSGKPQWQAFSLLAFCVVTFLGGIGTLVWLPVKGDIGDLKMMVAEQNRAFVTKSDMEYRLQVSGQRRDDFQRASEQRDADTMKQVEFVREKIVPRGEHEEKWRGNEQRLADVQRQIDVVNKAFGDTFSLRDALQQMQRRIDTLEAKPPRPAG